MKRHSFLHGLIFCLLFFFYEPWAQAQVHASWNLLENKFTSPEQHSASLSLTNAGEKPIQAGWKLYFNTIFISIFSQSLDPKLQLKHLQGDFFVLEGQTPALDPKKPFSFAYRSRGPFFKNSYAPEALILVHADGKIEEIKHYEVEEISESNLASMATGTPLPVTSSAQRYEQNRAIFPLSEDEIPPYLPSPKEWKYTAAALEMTPSKIVVEGPTEFHAPKEYVEEKLLHGYRVADRAEEDVLRIRLEKVESFGLEAYGIKTVGKEVLIQASSPAGAWFGVNSFLALLPPAVWKEGVSSLILPQVEIHDEPAFGYRGFFLDVARNFQPKEQIFKILELMSFYKLNVFHFNLANDEGWRIEIPGLPELTDFGARRGFSENESEFLYPYYGSGAFPEQSVTGTGFYTVKDFQEILAFAKQRNIEVIPELGVPAHSRAAILAMEKRYQSYASAGKMEEALAYRLADPEDQSKYRSAQNFTGNTVCVCQESTYAFYEKLVVEIGKMYASVGLEGKNWHSGGDEVPKGVWTASPICQEFLAKNPDLSQDELLDYFRLRIGDILTKQGWQMGGWEEIGQSHQGEEVVPNEKLSSQQWKLYAWNAAAGWGGEDMAYRLANAGYPVVICSSANFYFDLANSWDPDDRGHTWSGVVDMYQSWKTVPGKLYLSHDQTLSGDPWNWEDAEEKFTLLTEKGRKNILGVSGQLWTETVKGTEMLENYLFPKMLGYVERAWKGDPEWSRQGTEEEMKESRKEEWNQFVNLVGQKELPRLEKIAGGVSFALPKPGVAIKDDRVMVNSAFPGMDIRYTDSGAEPNANSPIYREPIYYRPGYTPRFKLFLPSGRSGRSAGID
ncbi:MAG: family 20 glycosylhydrolase [Bacteroidetes bacterium]|nr:family 20 glycosylhydrolase [Bacteroidota bacterium]